MPSSPTVSRSRLALTAPYLLAWPTLQLGLSGDWRWREGWIFAIWFVALCATCIGWLYRNDPALLAERYRTPGSGGQSRADELIVYGLLLGFVAWIVVPPLDARRFGWSPRLSSWVEASGGALLLAAAFFFFRSFSDNPYLSPLVRVQPERRQQVVSTGVYGLVRHPMYLGASLMFVGGPLLLGSVYGLPLGLALVLLLVLRIAGEERLLARVLEGYEAYRGRVRYRLLPHVW
jgi:protein-S-isoprenylcysteine O-methyltransferase Ste14